MKLFDKSKIGIKVSDISIELVEVSLTPDASVVTNFKREMLEEGVLKGGEIRDKKKLSKIILRMMKNGENGEFSKGGIVFGIQENNIYSHLLNLDLHSKTYEEEFRKKTSHLLPEDFDDYAYQKKNITNIENFTQEGEEKNLIYFNAVKKEYLSSWTNFFKKLGHEIDYFEPETHALGRVVEGEENDFLIVNIEKNSAVVSVFLNKSPFYSYEILFLDENAQIGKEESISEENLSSITEEIELSLDFITKKTSRKIYNIYILDTERDPKRAVLYFSKELSDLNLGIILFKESIVEKNIQKYFYIPSGLARGEHEKGGINFIQDKNKFFSINIFSSLKNIKHKKFIKIILPILLLFIAVALGRVIFSPELEQKNDSNQIEQKYINSDIFYYNIFLSTDNIENKNEISGRIVDLIFDEPISRDKILVLAKKRLSAQILEGEFYWELPLGEVLEGDSLIFPLRTSWFVGDKKKLDKIVSKNVLEKLSNIDNFDISVFTNTPVENIEFPTLYKTKLRVDLDHNLEISKYNLDEDILKRILIVNTNGNSINIRKGPGISYPVIAKALGGQVYTYIRDLDSWTNIKLEDGSLAWISGRFTKIID